MSTSWNVIAKEEGPEGSTRRDPRSEERVEVAAHRCTRGSKGSRSEKADEGDPVPKPVQESLEHGGAIDRVERVLYVRGEAPQPGSQARRRVAARGITTVAVGLAGLRLRGRRLLHAMAESMGEEASGQRWETSPMADGRAPAGGVAT